MEPKFDIEELLEVLNMFFSENDNLEAVVVQGQVSGNTYIFSSDPNISSEFPTFEVYNLNNYKSTIKDACNFNNPITLTLEEKELKGVVVLKPGLSARTCCIPRHCPPK